MRVGDGQQGQEVPPPLAQPSAPISGPGPAPDARPVAAAWHQDGIEPARPGTAAAVSAVGTKTAAGAAGRPVIYQLLVRSFSNVSGQNRQDGDITVNGVGKFADIDDRALDGLKELGTTHVWLTGVLRQATATAYPELGLPADDPDILKGKAGSPYAVRDYYDVSPDYAVDPARRLEELRALIDRCHRKGLKVLIDFVPNHVARSYHSVIRPEDDFGKHDDPSRFFLPSNNFFYLQEHPGQPLRLRKPSHWEPPPGADERFEPEDGKPGHPVRMTGNVASYDVGSNDWKEVVKLNYGYDPRTGEKRFDPIPDTWWKMDRVLAYWQELGVDGFRVDYAHVVPVEFWQWAVARARQRNPDTYLAAEAYDTSPDAIPGFKLTDLLDAGFDSVYDDALYDGLRDVVLGSKWANDIDGWLEAYAGREAGLLHYGENHDEVRIAAKRRAALHDSGLGDAWAGRPLSAVLFLATSGPSLIYNGQEVGEPAAGAEGFGGDDGRSSIFDYWKMPQLARWVGPNHTYDGAGLDPEARRLRRFYADLLNLSRQPPFAGGARYNLQWFNKGRSDYDDGRSVYSFLRHDPGGKRALVVMNLSGHETVSPTVRVPPDALAKMGLGPDDRLRLKSLLGAKPPVDAVRAGALAEGGLEVELEPYGVTVISLDDAPRPGG